MTTTSKPFYLVDAFATGPFTGNPAAVVILDGEADPDWMQAVAQEMKQSETAFVRPQGNDWGLRWFTPGAEVDLCGHATLASAHVLWRHQNVATDLLRFVTRSGVLGARRESSGRIELDFPANPVVDTTSPGNLGDIIGTEPVRVGRGAGDLIVEVSDEATVRRLSPDLTRIAQLPTRGVVITALASEPGADFVSRCFFPALGVAEDPVTGSAHTALAPYWAERIGKPALIGYQCSPRGGWVHCRIEGSRVLLSGNALTTVTGELLA